MKKRCFLLLASFFLIANWAFAQPSKGSVLDSLENTFESSNDRIEKANTAILLSKSYASIDITKAGKFAKAALRTTTDTDSLRIDALDQMARYYFFSSKLDSAEYYFLEAKTLANNKGDQHTSASLGISIASLNLRQSKFENAISLLTESANFFEKQTDEANAAKCYINMGTAYAELAQYPQAIKYTELALDIFQRNKQDQYTLIALPNLATQYLKEGDTTKAIQTFLEAERFALDKNNQRSLALTYNNLGDLYMGRKNYNTASDYINKSLQLKKELKIKKGQDNNNYNLGKIKAEQGDHISAIKYYSKGLIYADQNNKVFLFQSLRDSYKALGKYRRSLEFAELAQATQDSLNKVQNVKEFAEVSEKYEATKKQNEILQLQNENQGLQLSKNRNRIYSILSISLLSLVSLLSLYIFNNQKKKRQISNQRHKIEQQDMIDQLRNQELNTIDRIIEGQEKERHKIAADLHDSLGSKMATLKLYMENLAESISGDKSMIVKATELTDTTYKEIRDMSHAINSGVLTDKGLIPALKNMASFISNSNKLKIQIIDVDIQNRLENSVEIQLFRIIQELVTNIIKHAKATEATIQIVDHQDSLNILVEDNGKGFDVLQSTNGMGLNSIKTRVKNINGTVDFDSSETIGTSIMINIPV